MTLKYTSKVLAGTGVKFKCLEANPKRLWLSFQNFPTSVDACSVLLDGDGNYLATDIKPGGMYMIDRLNYYDGELWYLGSAGGDQCIVVEVSTP